jgi:hypothetical protein
MSRVICASNTIARILVSKCIEKLELIVAADANNIVLEVWSEKI